MEIGENVLFCYILYMIVFMKIYKLLMIVIEWMNREMNKKKRFNIYIIF